jgi:hypothetical protein
MDRFDRDYIEKETLNSTTSFVWLGRESQPSKPGSFVVKTAHDAIRLQAVLAYKRPKWNAENEGDSTYFEVLQAIVQLCTIYSSNISSLFLSMPYALVIRAGRLGQSVSRNECHKARLTDANPVELINVMATDVNHIAFLTN